jgi:hypothetical protein
VNGVLDPEESRQMAVALAAIRAKLAQMRLESDASLARLSAIRHAADLSAAERDELRARLERETAP